MAEALEPAPPRQLAKLQLVAVSVLPHPHSTVVLASLALASVSPHLNLMMLLASLAWVVATLSPLITAAVDLAVVLADSTLIWVLGLAVALVTARHLALLRMASVVPAVAHHPISALPLASSPVSK